MKKLLLLTALCASLAANAQWSDGQPVRLWTEDVSYPDYLMKSTSDGYTWVLTNRIDKASNGEASELIYAQGFDKDGNTLLGSVPKLLSDEYYQTYTLIQDNLLVDKDSNSLYGVLDHRSGSDDVSITVYKISPDGNMLWGQDGINIDGGFSSEFIASLCGVQLEDGSYVFAWMSTNTDSTYEIVIQRVSESGTFLWEPYTVVLSGANTTYEYPHLMNAGNNQFLLCYATGSNEAINVMKYDFDGTPVWSSPTQVYNGGWGSTPLWFKISYAPSGDGGVLVYWYADPEFDNIEDAYMQYVKPDGKLGFNVKNGLQLDYQEYMRHLGVKGVYEPSTDSFVAIMEVCDQNQVFYGVKAQRVSKSGDLLWGEEAKDIVETDEQILGYVSVQTGNPGEVAFFYEHASEVRVVWSLIM